MTTTRDLATAAGQPWLIFDTAHRHGPLRAAHAATPDHSPAGWLAATVPGVVTQDLLAQGRIADPYHGDQVMACRWIEERDWVYRTTIAIGEADLARPCRLVCDSLDVFAELRLNGEIIAEHSNQFRRLIVDLGGRLRAGDNILTISFEASWPGTVRRAGERLPYWNDPWERLWVRRSQMSFGWDWASRTPLAGILAPIRLEFSDGAWGGDLHLQASPAATSPCPGRGPGRLQASLPLQATMDLEGRAELLLDGTVVATCPVRLAAGSRSTVELRAEPADVAYWFPRELGEPALHLVEVRVHAGDRLVHSATQRVGFRRIELERRDPASPNGKVFRFAINGHRLWAKGDNWLPIDFMHPRTTAQQHRDYLGLLQAGGVNCIRIWGGGIVEQPSFYDACDELGLIIWHDFFFACGVYPRTPEFLAEVRAEVTDIVSRLRSRTCIALWCGNNENEVLAASQMKNGEPLWWRRHPIYYEVIPAVLAELDPQRAWWPGSPASESMEVHPDSDGEGDRHNWDVWFGWNRTDHIPDQARFNSEFGAQSFPQRESIESFIHPDETFTPGAVSKPQGMSPGLLLARHGAQFEKLFGRAGAFGPLGNLDAIIATTQAFQADTIGRYVRHYRRNIAFTGGVVVWNYTSTWPSVCWALVDWYRRPKQAYYECRRAFRPLVVGIEPTGPEQRVFEAHVARDRSGDSRGEAVLELRRIADGAVVASSRGAFSLSGPAASTPARLELPSGLDRTTHALVATATHADGIERDVRYLCLLNDATEAPGGRRLVHPKSGTLHVRRLDDRVEIAASAWRVRVGLESLEHPAVWDDNYLDLLPGESRCFRIAHGAMPHHLWVVADMGTRRALPPRADLTL